MHIQMKSTLLGKHTAKEGEQVAVIILLYNIKQRVVGPELHFRKVISWTEEKGLAEGSIWRQDEPLEGSSVL